MPSTSAAAVPVLVLGHHEHAKTRNDPYLRGPTLTLVPASSRVPSVARGRRVVVRRAVTAAKRRERTNPPPTLAQLTLRGRAKHPTGRCFWLTKTSHVGITITQGTRPLFLTSASFPYGTNSFLVPSLARPGTYGVLPAATDLAGNPQPRGR